MPTFSTDTLERDLAAILGTSGHGPARGGEHWARHLAIALAVLAPLAFAALHQAPAPERGTAFAPSAPVTSAPLNRPAASAFSAGPALPVPQPTEAMPFQAAPRMLVAERPGTAIRRVALASKTITTRRRPEPQPDIAPLPARERLTLAQGMPSEEEHDNEGTISTTELGRIQVRAARLEAVDAIRTLRLR